jgi:hypothetical protein
MQVEGIVGNPTAWAPFQEHGTTGPYSGLPPLAKVEGWAERKGWGAYDFATYLQARGNRAVKMLQKALDKNRQQVFDRIGNFVFSLFARSGKYRYPTTRG